MQEIKSINGYTIKDETARANVEHEKELLQALREEHNQLKVEHDSLEQQHASLREDYESLNNDFGIYKTSEEINENEQNDKINDLQKEMVNVKNNLSIIIEVLYPVGSIYMSVNQSNPSLLFGGTWEQIKDTFLLASGDKYQIGTSGGEENHTLTLEELPEHNHTRSNDIHTANYTITGGTPITLATGSEISATNGNYFTDVTGGNQPHNNMPPYLTVNMWKRTA